MAGAVDTGAGNGSDAKAGTDAMKSGAETPPFIGVLATGRAGYPKLIEPETIVSFLRPFWELHSVKRVDSGTLENTEADDEAPLSVPS
jgi:hypothetical protein